MKKLLITSLFLILGNIVFAQVGVSAFGNISTPGHLLSPSTYSPLGGGGGMGLLYRADFGPFAFDAGLDAQILVMGSKTYRFGEDRDEYYNTAFSGNLFVRAIYDQYKWKPYLGVFTGGLLTSVNEKFYVAGEEENATELTLSDNGSYTRGLSFGLLYEINPSVNFEIGASYARSNEGVSYFDFSTAHADDQFVNYQISSAANYDMWAFKLGFVFFLDMDDFKNSTSSSSNCNSCCNGGGGMNFFSIWPQFHYSVPQSHGKVNGHGKFFK
ncbi:MAG: hypothetical protein ACKOXB_09960 [Flavobacteriales bacterium]